MLAAGHTAGRAHVAWAWGHRHRTSSTCWVGMSCAHTCTVAFGAQAAVTNARSLQFSPAPPITKKVVGILVNQPAHNFGFKVLNIGFTAHLGPSGRNYQQSMQQHRRSRRPSLMAVQLSSPTVLQQWPAGHPAGSCGCPAPVQPPGKMSHLFLGLRANAYEPPSTIHQS